MEYKIKQITVYVENTPGKLSEISHLLGEEDVDIRAISLADTAETSTIRILVNNPERGVATFKKYGYDFTEEKVLVVKTPDSPGGLNQILKPLRLAHINVLHLYPFIGRLGSHAIIILGVDDINKAI